MQALEELTRNDYLRACSSSLLEYLKRSPLCCIRGLDTLYNELALQVTLGWACCPQTRLGSLAPRLAQLEAPRGCRLHSGDSEESAGMSGAWQPTIAVKPSYLHHPWSAA